jgi:hypothetical protein
VLHRHEEGLEERPVVLRREELPHAVEELVDQAFLLLLGRRLREVQGDRVIQTLVLLSGLVRKRLEDRLFLQLVERGRERDLVLDVDVGERAFAL